MKIGKIIKSIGLLFILLFVLASCMPKKEKKVVDGDTVLVNYIGTFENGEEFDNSYKRGSPLEFVVGGGGVISGFDKAVLGLKVGEKNKVTVSPEEGYGLRDETRVDVVPRSELKEFEDMGIILEKGSKLPTMIGDFEIIDTDDENITIDMNHQMAGKTLIFDVELVEIKDKKTN